MKGCLEEATLQSYFDGELPCREMEFATEHINSCEACAEAARKVEREMTILAAAFAPEVFLSVPTALLRERIYGAIAELRR